MRLTKVVNDMIGAPCLIFYVEMELLQECGPLLMAVILQFALCLHELQILVISVDDCLLPENVVLPLLTGLYNGIHFIVIGGVLMNAI
jgi:hypothetical protein